MEEDTAVQREKNKANCILCVCGPMRGTPTNNLQVSDSMKDLCYDVYGVSKEKKDPKEVKGHRDLLGVLPEKRKYEDGGCMSDDDKEDSVYKKRKRTDQQAYEKWKSSVLESNNSEKVEKVANKRTKQARLNFPKADPDTKRTEIKLALDFLFARHPSNILHA